MSGQKLYLIVLGPAGSGKSTLVGSFSEWVEKVQGVDVGRVNLDPGAEYLPYEPDVDARKYVQVRDLMLRQKLGPNGALVVSMEVLYEVRSRLLEEIDRLDSEVIMVDTPGQMELFIFHEAGPAFTLEFSKRGAACALILFDASLTRRPSEFVSLRLMGLITQLRLEVPTLIALNKGDLQCSQEVKAWIDNPQTLHEDLLMEKGVISEIAVRIAKVLDDYSLAMRVPMISALRSEGLEELYDLIHETWCVCGDLT